MGIGMRLEKFRSWCKTDYSLGKSEAKRDIYEKYGIPDNYGILISVGEITQRKNHIVMIDAMKELLDLPLVYIICGSGPEEDKLKAYVHELGLESRVKFAGTGSGNALSGGLLRISILSGRTSCGGDGGYGSGAAGNCYKDPGDYGSARAYKGWLSGR